MTPGHAALPSSPSDAPSVQSDLARWEALFGSKPPPRSPALVAAAIAWQEQVLAMGDAAPAITHDLAIVAYQVRVARLGQQGGLQSASCAMSPEPEPRSMRAPEQPTAQDSASCAIDAAPITGAARRPPAPRSRGRSAPAPLPTASSQLQVGARLVKVHTGATHVVEVTADGMRYEGQTFASLSAVARHITGTHWNGLLFFGLRRRKTYPQARRG